MFRVLQDFTNKHSGEVDHRDVTLPLQAACRTPCRNVALISVRLASAHAHLHVAKAHLYRPHPPHWLERLHGFHRPHSDGCFERKKRRRLRPISRCRIQSPGFAVSPLLVVRLFLRVATTGRFGCTGLTREIRTPIPQEHHSGNGHLNRLG
jgi:hypothetical protein